MSGFPPGPPHRGRWGTLAGAAVLVAGVTIAARVVGFGRWLVFGDAVGASCLGTAYSTANMVPNIVFEIVAGGALAGAVVPLLAAPGARGEVDLVRRTASALLTWVVVVLVPLSALGMLAAGPLMRVLVGQPQGCDTGDVVQVATGMFVIFAPQVALYGIAVVTGGLLNASRRFLAAALAPLVSSLVVVAAYVAFGAGYAGSRDDLAGLPQHWQLVLSLGTTAGVLALALTTAVPVRRLRLGLRPTLRFPPGVAVRARGLAAAGVTALLAQQVWLVVVLLVANDVGGAINVFNFAWAVYLLPYAVLAVPIATSAFTALSEQAGHDPAAVARTAATTTRAVVLAGLLGAALLAGTAGPVARTFIAPEQGPGPQPLVRALVAFAPGLVGFGLVALLSRLLYATGAGRAAALGTAAGWGIAAAGGLLTARVVPGDWLVAAVGAWTSVGMTVAAAVLGLAALRAVGSGLLAGLPRSVLAGLCGALAGAAVAAGAASLVEPAGKPGAGLLAAASAAAGAVAYVGVAAAVDRRDVVALVRRRGALRG